MWHIHSLCYLERMVPPLSSCNVFVLNTETTASVTRMTSSLLFESKFDQSWSAPAVKREIIRREKRDFIPQRIIIVIIIVVVIISILIIILVIIVVVISIGWILSSIRMWMMDTTCICLDCDTVTVFFIRSSHCCRWCWSFGCVGGGGYRVLKTQRI